MKAGWESCGELKKTLREIFALMNLSHIHKLPPFVESDAGTHGLEVFGTDSERAAVHDVEQVAAGSYVAELLRTGLVAEGQCVGQLEHYSDHTPADCTAWGAVGPVLARSVGVGFAHLYYICTGYLCMRDC